MNSLPYLFGIAALLGYAWHESKKEKVSLGKWLFDPEVGHKAVMIAAAVAMCAIVYFRDIICTVVAVPIALSLAAAWLSGSLLNMVIGYLTKAWQYLFGGDKTKSA